MTIECYKASCPKHSCHTKGEEGPFCYEDVCIESEHRIGPDPATLTCNDCPERCTCKFVDDWYNTDGDCIAYK
jgi:hypothetical protein